MNKLIIKTILKSTLLVTFLFTWQIAFSQDKVPKSINEVITQNPTAEEDLKVVRDYLMLLLIIKWMSQKTYYQIHV